jgi:hypothetical protein
MAVGAGAGLPPLAGSGAPFVKLFGTVPPLASHPAKITTDTATSTVYEMLRYPISIFSSPYRN